MIILANKETVKIILNKNLSKELNDDESLRFRLFLFAYLISSHNSRPLSPTFNVKVNNFNFSVVHKLQSHRVLVETQRQQRQNEFVIYLIFFKYKVSNQKLKCVS